MSRPPRSLTAESRRRRARVFGVLALCGALVCALLAVLGYSTTGFMPEMLGVALTATVLAVLWLILALLGFQAAKRLPDTVALSGPLRLTGILGFAVGAAGGVVTAVIGAAQASPIGVYFLALLLLLGVVTFTISAMLYTLVIPPKK